MKLLNATLIALSLAATGIASAALPPVEPDQRSIIIYSRNMEKTALSVDLFNSTSGSPRTALYDWSQPRTPRRSAMLTEIVFETGGRELPANGTLAGTVTLIRGETRGGEVIDEGQTVLQIASTDPLAAQFSVGQEWIFGSTSWSRAEVEEEQLRRARVEAEQHRAERERLLNEEVEARLRERERDAQLRRELGDLRRELRELQDELRRQPQPTFRSPAVLIPSRPIIIDSEHFAPRRVVPKPPVSSPHREPGFHSRTPQPNWRVQSTIRSSVPSSDRFERHPH